MTSSLHSGIRRCQRRSGAALIIVLALLVLITALMAIFLSRALIERKVSASSASGNSASILARSAVDMITGDLRQEIVNGSTTNTVGPATNQTILYYPISPTNMVPQRAGIATNSAGVDQAPNLIRRSLRSDALAVPSRASAVNSSTDPSYNGRSIALSRWNSHYLIPRLNAGSSTIDSTPIAAFTAPDWVMVTTNGPTVMTTPNPGTIGRYAYAIYDEGGLLDANVAGYPSGMTNYLPSQLAGKGSLALADLTAIGLTTTDVDNLVGWRNYATVQPSSGSFGSYNFSSDNNATTNYYNYVSTTTNGFLTINPQQYNSRTDQAFSSRQALLKYQRAAGFSQDALEYLGTFSRDLEQPNFQPDPARSKNHYLLDTDNSNDTCGTAASNNTTGTNQDLINPSLLAVRDAVGAPVLKRRFPLSRLSILEQAQDTLRAGGTLTPAVSNQVYDYFGLTWDSTNSRWTYGHSDTTTIYRLAQIPAAAGTNPDGTPREPDFFETLKAVINCDSLGKQHGSLDLNTSISPHGPSGSLIDGQIHLQLIQIGADLIDQYDADSYPTCIAFNGTAIYGVENLPYLAGWETMWYQMKALAWGTDINSTVTKSGVTAPTSGTVYQTSVMLQPILWNPHAPASATVPGPTNFRVVCGSMADVATTIYPESTGAGSNPSNWSWWLFSVFPPQYPATATFASNNGMTASGAYFAYPQATVDPSVAMIDFNSGVGGAQFLEPYRLHTPNDPPSSNAQNDSGYPAGQITIGADPTLVAADGGSTTAIGFFLGNCWTGPNINTQDHTGNYLSRGALNNSLKFRLQYKSPGGTWLTYDTIDNVYTSAGIYSTVAMPSADVPPQTRGFMTCFKVDPRTDRWGCYHLDTFPTTGTTTLPIGVAPNPSTSGTSSNGPWDNGVTTFRSPPLYNLPESITLGPNSTGSYIGMGNNTGGAAAVGWAQPSNPNPADLSVNLAPSTASPPTPNPNVGTSTTTPPGGKNYYTDADGVFRRATGGNFTGSDGLPEYTGNYNSRPVVLNRPFRSIAEMGYAFRGQAWKQLDFANPESGDSALFEAFCLNEVANAPSDMTVAGRVNLNTHQVAVLQSLIQGVSTAEGGTISIADANNAAKALVNWTAADPTQSANQTGGVFNKGPLRNRAELIGKFVSQVVYTKPTISLTGGQTPILDGSKTYSGYSSLLTSPGVFASSTDASIERRRECVLRALADSGNVRTWNLLIDVVAQTGRFAPTAKTPADIAKFIVNGECRYWVHVAIDRYTGAIISESFEPVED